VRAEAPYTDTLEARGNLVFPVPKVRVWDRGSLPFHAYLPAVFDKGCARKGPPADVVLVIDASVSMSDPAVGGGSKLEAAQAAAKGFLANLRPSDRAGVVSFNREAHRLSELTADRQALTAAIDGISISPGTVIDLGLQAATAELTGARPDASRAVILLTDGQNNQGPAAVVVAANGVKGTGALLFTVGLGDNIDRALLRQAASSPEQYFEAPDAAALKRIYEEIAATLPCAR
jgi:uncharacterized protein (DUF58 family)